MPPLPVWSWLQTKKRKEAVTSPTSIPPAVSTQQIVGIFENQVSSFEEQHSDTSMTSWGSQEPSAASPITLPEPGSHSHHLLTLWNLHTTQRTFWRLDCSPSPPTPPHTSRPPLLSPPRMYVHALGNAVSSFNGSKTNYRVHLCCASEIMPCPPKPKGQV